MNSCRTLSFIFASVILSAAAANAQIAAELRGRVLDASGAAIPNARVELIQSSTSVKQTTLSTTSGDYVFINLAPGSYTLNAAAPRFQHLTRTGITVITGQTITADLSLSLGPDQQTVTVTGDLPLLQSATSNIQTNIPHAAVVAMPLNTRNFVQLATLAPGIELPPGNAFFPASTAAALAPTSISTTASPPSSPSPDRSLSSHPRRHPGIHH